MKAQLPRRAQCEPTISTNAPNRATGPTRMPRSIFMQTFGKHWKRLRRVKEICPECATIFGVFEVVPITIISIQNWRHRKKNKNSERNLPPSKRIEQYYPRGIAFNPFMSVIHINLFPTIFSKQKIYKLLIITIV